MYNIRSKWLMVWPRTASELSPVSPGKGLHSEQSIAALPRGCLTQIRHSDDYYVSGLFISIWDQLGILFNADYGLSFSRHQLLWGSILKTQWVCQIWLWYHSKFQMRVRKANYPRPATGPLAGEHVVRNMFEKHETYEMLFSAIHYDLPKSRYYFLSNKMN